MTSHMRSFQCFDAIVDNCPQKASFPVGHRFSAPQRSSHGSTRLEPLEDHGCYLCADHQQAKPMTSEAPGIQSTSSYQPQTHQHQHSHRRPTRPDGEPADGAAHHHHHHHHRHSKRIVLVKNSDPSIQKTIVLHRRTVRSLGVFLDDVSELMQCLIRKLYTLEGCKIDSIQSLLQCPSILVCVGREPFHPLFLNSFRKNSDDKLPKLVLKSRSSACNEEQGRKNVNFGPETKKSIIHPRSYSNDKSARLSMSSEKSFPQGLNSVPPGHMGSYTQARESTMDDDIEKRVLVNKDGSLSMEMKVRFRLLNDETLHWSTQIKKSSGMLNESFTGSSDAYLLQHSNSESCSEAESLSADDADNAKLHQKHLDEPHCQHCCSHCQEYDIWKNPVLGEQGPVRHIRSSSSSASSHKIVCKKASADSMHTMSSEEYTEQVVEKATCIQQIVGEEGETTVEYCTISRCCSRSEICSVSAKKAYTEEKYGKGENGHVFINDEKKTESALSTIPFKDLQKDHVSVQITQTAQEEERPVSVESNSSQVLASLKEDQDEEEIDFLPSNSKASQSNNQEDDVETRDVASSPQYVTSCKSPISPKHQLSPRPPCKVSGCLVKSRSRHYQKSKNVMLGEKEASEINVLECGNQPQENILNEADIQDTATEERALSSTSTISKPDNDTGYDTTLHAEINEMERSSSAMSTKSNASGQSGKTSISVIAEHVKDNPEERTSAMSFNSNISARSRQSKLSEVATKETREAEKQIEERAQSAMSNTSTRSRQSRVSEVTGDEFGEVEDLPENRVSSAMSAVSARSNSSRISQPECFDLKEVNNQIQDRSPSTMSVKSNASVQSKKSHFSEVTSVKSQNMETQERVSSTMSTKSNVSATSQKSKVSQGTAKDTVESVDRWLEETQERVPSTMSTKSNASATSHKSKVSQGTAKDSVETCDRGLEERVPSAMSAKSNTSVKSNVANTSEAVSVMTCEDSEEHSDHKVKRTMSHTTVGTKTPNTPLEMDSQNNEAGGEGFEERAPSARSIKSNSSARSKKSKVSSVAPVKANELEEDLENKAPSAMSSRSAASSRSEKYKKTISKCEDTVENTEELQERSPSVMSSRSHASERSKKPKTSEAAADESADFEGKSEERAPSALSIKSNTSTKTNKSAISEYVDDIANEEATERSTSALSSKSNVSTKSKKSKMSLLTDEGCVGLENQAEERPPSKLSVKSYTSERSSKSKVSEILNKECIDVEERFPGAMTPKSNVSERSMLSEVSEIAHNDAEDTDKQTEQRASSAMSVKSNTSGRSKKSNISIVETDETFFAEQEDSSAISKQSNHSTNNEEHEERVGSALSKKSDVSVKSYKSKVSELPSEEPEHLDEEKRTPSGLSCNSSVSIRSTSSKVSANELKDADCHTEERDPSTTSAKSKTGKTKKVEKPKITEPKPDSPAEVTEHPDERAGSVMSAMSNTSAKSKKSTGSDAQCENVFAGTCQTGERSQSELSIRTNASARSTMSKASEAHEEELVDENEKERALSAMCCKSIVSTTSNKSKVSDTVIFEPAEKDTDIEERSQSTTSAKSYVSSRSKISEVSEEAPKKTTNDEEKEDMVESAMSPCSLSERSIASARTKNSKSADNRPKDPEEYDGNSKRALSAASLKSNISARSKLSESSEIVLSDSADIDQTATRSPSVLSAKSNTSTKSKKSSDMGLKGKEEETDERSTSAVSAKSNDSLTSKRSKSESAAEEEHLENKAPNTTSIKMGSSTEHKKSDISTQIDNSGNVDTAEPEETEEKMKREGKELGPMSPKSNISSRSAKSKSSALTGGQITESEALNERSASALSNESVKSKHSQRKDKPVQKENNDERSPSTLSVHGSTSAIFKNNISEVKPHAQRSTSPASAKSNSSAKSIKSRPSKTRADGDVQMKEELQRATSEVSAISNISTKSNKSKVEEGKENCSNPENSEPDDKRVKSALSDHSKASSPVKCVCGGSKKPKPATETQSTKKDDNEERSTSALSRKSAKSKTSSVSCTSELDLTPASASVSIGIVEEYDNIEEEHSMSVASTATGPPMKSKCDDCSVANWQGMQINESNLKPDERSQNSLSAGGHVSKNSKKSKCSNSNSGQSIADIVCATDDEVASNTSATKNTMENKSACQINTNSLVEKKHPVREEQSSSKVSSVSHSKERKLSPETDRPKSNMSTTSSHLKVKGKKSNSNSKSDNTDVQAKQTNSPSIRSTKEEDKLTRPRSADIYITSENRLSPSPSKSRSKRPVILLGGSNDSVLSQSVSGAEPLNDNSNNMNTGGDVSDRTNVSDRTCNGPLDVTDCGRDVSDKTSEKSSTCRNRKGSSSSQQKADDEISELVPSNLPNASPAEVVNDWLNKIPLDSAFYEVGDEYHEDGKELETLNRLAELTQNEKENESEGDTSVAVTESQIEKVTQLAIEETDDNEKEEAIKSMTDEDLEKNQSCPETNDAPKSFHSSVQVMRVLLSPKLDRCNSLPEVSTVYGRKLSTSARGLLDCLVNLELIDFDPNDVNGKAKKYKDLMNMLQSLWFCDPSDKTTVTQKSKSTDQQSIDDELKAKSSSGVDVSSGSTGSGNSSVNDGTQAQKSPTNAKGESPQTLTKVQEVEETDREEVFLNSDPATPDIASRVQWTPETETEGTVEEQIKDTNTPTSDDTIRSNDSPKEPPETPPSSNKSTGNEHQEDTSSGTPPLVHRAPLTKRVSQDPDPVWVLNLLNKLEKQFMTHYVNAMAEFKVRWNLDDNEQLDAMISELRDEVHRRIQLSIDRELKKIQGRAGRPKPPKGAMSRESTIQTEQKRRRLKVMLNQSIDPAVKSDDDYTATTTDFSDQRSDDEYCPCDTCVKKKMASKPVLPVEVLNSAPAMVDFDLRKILQLKRETPTNKKEDLIEEAGNEDPNTEVEPMAENDVLEDVKEEEEGDTDKAKLKPKSKSLEQDLSKSSSTNVIIEQNQEMQPCLSMQEMSDKDNKDFNEDHAITDSAEAQEAVYMKIENQDIHEEAAECETETYICTVEAETTEEDNTSKQEHLGDVSASDDVEAAKAEEIAEVETEGKETAEAEEAEIEEDVEEGSEESETPIVGDEDRDTEREAENAESEPTKQCETPDEQIQDKHKDAESLEKSETPERDLVKDEGETADETEETAVAIVDYEEETEHAAAEEKEDRRIMKDGAREQEDTTEPKKGITHYRETDDDESVEGKDKTKEETTGEETVDDGVVDQDKSSETAEDGDTPDDESIVEFNEIIDGNTANDENTTKLETAEAEEMADETAEDIETDNPETAEEKETADETTEDIQTDKANTAEDEATADDKTQEDEQTTNYETEDGEEASKAETAENGERTDEIAGEGETANDGTSMDEDTAENETAEDEDAAEMERAESGEAGDEEPPEDDGEVAKMESADNEDASISKTPEDHETDDETAQDGETSKADTADGENTDETGGDDKTDNRTEDDDKTAEGEGITDDEIADNDTGNDAATENGNASDGEAGEDDASEAEVETNDETAEEEREKDETAEDGETGDEATEDEVTSHEAVEADEIAGDEIAEDEESPDGATAEDGETADDKTDKDEEKADDGTAEDRGSDDDETAEDGETANDGTAEDRETDDETAEDGETANDGTAEDRETDDETAEDGETANDGTAEDGETANDETAEDGETANDGTAEDGETDDDGIAEDGETANDGTAEDGETDDDGIAEDGETANDGTAEDGETANDGTAEDGETANDGTAEDGETADNGTAEDRETADDGTSEDGETADNGTAKDGETPDDGTAEDRGTADDGTAEHEETADDESLENEEISHEGEETENGKMDESNTADGEEGEIDETGIVDMEQEETDDPVVNSSIENTDCHDEVTELKADDEADDEGVLYKNEGDIVVHSTDETASIEESKEDHTNNTKAEESSELMSDNQDKEHCETTEKDYLNGHLVNVGESAEGGDEAEDETEPDVDTDEEGKEMCSAVQAPVWSKQEDGQNNKISMAPFDAKLNISTGSEDGADADVEDSETEVHNKDVTAENEYEDDSVTTVRKQVIPHSPVEKEESEGHTKLSDIAEDAAEDLENEKTSKQDNKIIKDTDCRKETADNGLARQITKSSMESQPGSLEEVVDEETRSTKSSAHLTVKGNCMYPTITSEEDSKDTQEKSDTESAESSRHAATPKKAAKKSSKLKVIK